jgi:manganese/zinc/iron transport system permease protein
MTSTQFEIQLIAVLVATACSIIGCFLVLRKMAMISDAISHSILPGLVIGFFITEDLNSPLLILMATITGVVTVFLVEYIQKTGLVKEDTAIGLIFPSLFSIGVILIAKNANDIHLDVDAVLLGELAFAPFDRVIIDSVDYGPKSLWVISTILILIITLVTLFYKELKLSSFDAGLAASAGFSPVVLHYGLMSLASITTVGAFDAVGAILVVGFIIIPAATAYLLTSHLKKMISISISLGVISSILGYWLSYILDASIAGSIISVLGILFFSVYLFTPKRGLLSSISKRKKQQTEIALLSFLLHIKSHTDNNELNINHLTQHINWSKSKSNKIVGLALNNNLVEIENDIAHLTKKGTKFAENASKFITNNENIEIENMKDEYFLFRG